LKKTFIVIFAVFAFFVFEVAFAISVSMDTSNIMSWHKEPGFQSKELYLSADLGGEDTASIIKTLSDLSDIYGVNIFIRLGLKPTLHPHTATMSISDMDLELYARLQDDEYLEHLPAKGLQIQTTAQFNEASGIITNKKFEEKMGHFLTTSRDITYVVGSLQSLPLDEPLGQIYIAHRQGQFLTVFVNELQLRLPSVGIEEYNQHIQPQGFLFVLGYFSYLSVDILVAVSFLLLTTLIYIFNRQRDILIAKIHGLANGRVLFRYVRELFLSSLAVVLPLVVPYHLLHNGYVNVRLFNVFALYLLGLVMLVAVFMLLCALLLLYIGKLQPVSLLKRKQSNPFLIGAAFIIKAVTVPLIILSLAGSTHNLVDNLRLQGRLDTYRTQYGNYVRLVGSMSPAETTKDAEGKSYSTKVFAALNAEGLAQFIGGVIMDDFPQETTIGTTNSTFINEIGIVDVLGNLLHLEPDRRYTLVPERYYPTLLDIFRNKPILISSFYPSVPQDFNPFESSRAEVEALVTEAAEYFTVIQDNQPIPNFALDSLSTPDGTIDDYILTINDHLFSPQFSPRIDSIYIDVGDIDDYPQVVEHALAKHGLPMFLDYATTDEILSFRMRENKAALLKALRESLIYLVLLVYISYLTIFFYFKGNQQQVAVKVLHGQSLFGRFRGLFSFNLVLDCLLFLYLVLRGSYMGINVAFGIQQGIKVAFVTLLVLDTAILLLSIMSFKSRAMQSILKRNE
jgi:hypothetical protein